MKITHIYFHILWASNAEVINQIFCIYYFWIADCASHFYFIAASTMSSPVPEPPFNLFLAGIIVDGMSCVLLVDETKLTVAQQWIQHVSHLFFIDHINIDCASHFCLIVT